MRSRKQTTFFVEVFDDDEKLGDDGAPVISHTSSVASAAASASSHTAVVSSRSPSARPLSGSRSLRSSGSADQDVTAGRRPSGRAYQQTHGKKPFSKSRSTSHGKYIALVDEENEGEDRNRPSSHVALPPPHVQVDTRRPHHRQRQTVLLQSPNSILRLGRL
jgi:hypothetical protein